MNRLQEKVSWELGELAAPEMPCQIRAFVRVRAALRR
jgi:hypothetical protein